MISFCVRVWTCSASQRHRKRIRVERACLRRLVELSRTWVELSAPARSSDQDWSRCLLGLPGLSTGETDLDLPAAGLPFAFSGLLADCLRISLVCLHVSGSLAGCRTAPSHFSGLLAGCPFACLWVAWLPLCISLGCLPAAPFACLWVACQLPLRISLGCLLAARSHSC